MPLWKNTDTNNYANNKPAWLTYGHLGIDVPSSNNYIANTVLVTASRKSSNANTSTISLAYGQQGISHTGWVNFKIGTGGRAGRVTSEVLVAMSSPVGVGTSNNAKPFFTGI